MTATRDPRQDTERSEQNGHAEPSRLRRVVEGRQPAALIAALTTVTAYVVGIGAHLRDEFGDERVYRMLARHLLDEHYFGYTREQALAYRAPGYPFFDAFVRLFHDSDTAIRVAQALLAGVTVWLAAWIAGRLFGKAAGILAAVLTFAAGTIAVYATFELSETLSTLTLLSAIALVLVALDRKSIGYSAWSGFALGVSILTRPQTLLLLIPLAVLVALSHGFADRRSLKMGATLFAVTIATMLPWTIRNAIKLDAFVPVSTYGGVNFYIANNPKADGYFRRISVVLGEEEYRRIAALPEVEEDRAYFDLAFAFIRNNPGRSVRNWLNDGRLYLTLQDPLVPRHYRLSNGAAVPRIDDRWLWPLAAIGIAVAALRRDRMRALVPAIGIVYFLGFFMLFVPIPRFRHGVVPLLAGYAAAALCAAGGAAWRLAQPKRRDPGALRDDPSEG